MLYKGYRMKLIQAWAESLTLLKPENFKLFLLVTLKSIGQTYKVLFSKFWVLVIASLGMDLGAYYLLTQTGNPEFQVSSFLLIGLWVLIFIGATIALMALGMALFLIARPSVAIKDWNYLSNYWRHFIYFFFAWFIALICKHLFLPFFIYWIFFVAFLLDSNGRLQLAGLSLWRALKMLWYNLPFVGITTILFSLLFFPFALLLGYGQSILPLWMFILRFCVVNLIQLPLLICFYINFYVKKKHEQFNLYFPEKGQ